MLKTLTSISKHSKCKCREKLWCYKISDECFEIIYNKYLVKIFGRWMSKHWFNKIFKSFMYVFKLRSTNLIFESLYPINMVFQPKQDFATDFPLCPQRKYINHFLYYIYLNFDKWGCGFNPSSVSLSPSKCFNTNNIRHLIACSLLHPVILFFQVTQIT